jgi:hypothetical protein
MNPHRATITTAQARAAEGVSTSAWQQGSPAKPVWEATSRQAGDRTATRTTLRVWAVAAPVDLPSGSTIARTVYRWSASHHEGSTPWQGAAPTLAAAQQQAERRASADGLRASLHLSWYRAEAAKRKEVAA